MNKTHEWDQTKFVAQIKLNPFTRDFSVEKVDQDYKCIHCGIEKNKAQVKEQCTIRIMKAALE